MARMIAGGLPGVYMREVDLSETLNPVSGNDGAMILSGRSGPVNQRLMIHSSSELEQVFGVPFPEDDIGVSSPYYGAVEALKQSNQLTVVRVSDGNEKYANVNIGNKLFKNLDNALITYTPYPSEIQRKQASEAIFKSIDQTAWNDGIKAMDTAEAVSRCPEGFSLSTTKGKPGILDIMESDTVEPGTMCLASISPDSYGNDLAASVAAPPALGKEGLAAYGEKDWKNALTEIEFAVLNYYISQKDGRFLESSVYFGDKPNSLKERTTESFADSKIDVSVTPSAEWMPGTNGFDWFYKYDSNPVVPTDSDSPLIDICGCRGKDGNIDPKCKAGEDYPAYDVPRDGRGRSIAVWSKVIKLNIYKKPTKKGISYWEPLGDEIECKSCNASETSYVIGVNKDESDLIVKVKADKSVEIASDVDSIRIAGWSNKNDFLVKPYNPNVSFECDTPSDTLKLLMISDDKEGYIFENGFSILKWRDPIWSEAQDKWLIEGVSTNVPTAAGTPSWNEDNETWDFSVNKTVHYSEITADKIAVLRTERTVVDGKQGYVPVRGNYSIVSITNAVPYFSKTYWERITPEETFVCSLDRISDEGGNSLYIEDVVNGSSNLIVVNAKGAKADQLTRSTPTIIPFFGGYSPENYIASKVYTLKTQAVPFFSNRKTSQFGVFYVVESPTRATRNTYAAFAKTVSDLCSNELKRGDAMVLEQISCVDSDTENKIYEDTMAMHGTKVPSYTAGYAGYIYMADTKLRKEVLVPAVNAGISALLAGEKPWSAPMGVNRGTVPWSLGVFPTLQDDAWGRLYDVNANMVINEPSYGDCVWGQKTMQIKASSLSRINVRRVVLYIKRNIRPFLIPWLGEQYDDRMHNSIESTCYQFLKGVALEGGIYPDPAVIIDASDDLLANNQLNVILSFVPRYVIEKIQVTTAVLKVGMSPSGITFEEAYS